jgi:hypothetical protein
MNGNAGTLQNDAHADEEPLSSWLPYQALTLAVHLPVMLLGYWREMLEVMQDKEDS